MELAEVFACFFVQVMASLKMLSLGILCNPGKTLRICIIPGSESTEKKVVGI